MHPSSRDSYRLVTAISAGIGAALLMAAATPATANPFEFRPSAGPFYQYGQPQATQRTAFRSRGGENRKEEVQGPRRGERYPRQGQWSLERLRLDRQATPDALLRRQAGGPHQGLDRDRQPPDPDRRVQHHPAEPLAPLQPLRQCADVVHAADHLVRRRHAPGPRDGPTGLARLHPPARGVCPPAVGHHQDGQPRDRDPARNCAHRRSRTRSCSSSSARRSRSRPSRQ